MGGFGAPEALPTATVSPARRSVSGSYQTEDGVEQERTASGRGSPESAAWFREKLETIGIGQSALARLMIERGDDRQFRTILRSLGRMASGDSRVSGEMRALLGILKSLRKEAGGS